MLPACRTEGAGFSLPPFDLVPSDVEGFMDELWEFQSTFHDCCARSEPRLHFLDSMVGQCSKLERKSIEPIALGVEGGPSVGCSGLSGMSAGTRSRCGGTTLSLSPTPWGLQTAC